MKLATWNVNGVRSVLNKQALQEYLTSAQPDLLGLQEVKATMDQVPYDFAAAGYHVFWNAAERKGYSGTALLSKQPPQSVQYGIGIAAHDQEGRVITAEFEPYYVVVVYTPNAKRDLARLAYRQQWEDDFLAFLQKLDQHKPVMVCGDLNVAPQAIDLANPKNNEGNAGFTPEERAKFAQLTAQGFVDVFREKYPQQTAAYTWWSYLNQARKRNIGWRIDHVLVSQRLLPFIEDVVLRHDVFGSDHCPVEWTVGGTNG